MSTMERVASMDAVWLQIEQASNPMLVIGLMITQTPVTREQLESQLKASLLPLPRFSQRVLQGDLNGDGKADFEIKLVGVLELNTDDILGLT